MSRSSWYRQPSGQEVRDQPVIDALNAMIEKYPRWGFWMCYDRLRLDGHAWNHKRVYRVYKAMKLNLPRRKKRRLPQRVQQPMVVDAQANAEWSLDFMSDALYHGRRFRTLNVLDEGVREALDIVIDTSIPGARVVRTLERLIEWRGKPTAIRVDNGPEYTSYVFESLRQVREITRAWIIEYNEERPHSSLGKIPPAMFRRQVENARNSTLELCH